MVWPAIIAGAASLAGGLLGKSSQDKAMEQAELQNLRNEQLQREFAQQGIRWRVEDAKAAGLHPLFALGGGGATFTPGPIHIPSGNPMGEALASMGQGVSRAVAAQSTPDEQALRAAQLEHIRAQTNAANAQATRDLAASEASRLGQAQVATFPLGYHPSDSGIASRQLAEENRHFRMGLAPAVLGQSGPGTQVLQRGAVEKARDVTSPNPADLSRTAGVESAWNMVTMFPGDRFSAPVRALMPVNQEGWSEGLESMPLYMIPSWIGHNVQQFGWKWPFEMLTGLGESRGKGAGVDDAIINALRKYVGRFK